MYVCVWGHPCSKSNAFVCVKQHLKQTTILYQHLKNSLEDVHAAIAALKAAGFDNYSVDLIGGLPGQVR